MAGEWSGDRISFDQSEWVLKVGDFRATGRSESLENDPAVLYPAEKTMMSLRRSLLNRLLAVVAAFAAVISSGNADDAPVMTWLRVEAKEGAATGWFRWAIDPAAADGESSQLSLVSDQPISVYVNGQRILKNQTLQKSDVAIESAGWVVSSRLSQGRKLG
ncbi:MAG: hypothetical protein ACK58L_19900, partial [Planctomycetota bacterium]